MASPMDRVKEDGKGIEIMQRAALELLQLPACYFDNPLGNGAGGDAKGIG
jgi:hypothetical protein